ncbi:MAG: hypothetical protein Q4F00_02950 [bacterium]|nr:hypothetical protein [bacterium]
MSWEEMDKKSWEIASSGAKIKKTVTEQVEAEAAAKLHSKAGEEHKASFERLNDGLKRYKNSVEAQQSLSPRQKLESQSLRLPKGEVPAAVDGAESLAMRVAAARIGRLEREGREHREQVKRRCGDWKREHNRQWQSLAGEFAAGRREMQNCRMMEDDDLL